MIRITPTGEGADCRLLVEGTLAGASVQALEVSWLIWQAQPSAGPACIDLSGVTYIDDRGRELLMRMMRSGAEVRATGIMTRRVIEEIAAEIGDITSTNITSRKKHHDNDR